MDAEIAAQLERIGNLLQRRVEVAEESRNATDARLADIRQRQEELKEQSEARRSEIAARVDARAEKDQKIKEKVHEMDKEFHEAKVAEQEFKSALLAELRRHNNLLEKLLEERRH